MTAVLRDQLEAANRWVKPSIDDRETLEQLVIVGVSLFEATKASVARWKQHAHVQSRQQIIDDARDYLDVYRQIDQLLERAEASAGAILPGDLMQALAAARAELRVLLSISIDRMIQSEAQLAAGQTRPLGEVMDELRRRHHG